jgi:hypothetical protein
MNLFRRAIERALNDEPETPFDAEPGDLAELDADAYTQPDVGDEESQ